MPVQQIKRLTPEQLEVVRQHLRRSPTATLLLNYYLQCKGKPNAHDAVKYIYNIGPEHDKYRQHENRFYKLRKKLQELVEVQVKPDTNNFTKEELALFQAKTFIASGQYKEALKLLEKTKNRCTANNLFELLPEVLDNLLMAKQALNQLDNDNLHQEFDDALVLYKDLMEAKNLTRKVYEANFKTGKSATEPLYKRLAALSRKHAAYPRFRLIYNFVAGYYKTGAKEQDYFRQTNVTNRHIGVAKKILFQYPDMPVVQHTGLGRQLQQYRLMQLQSMVYYNSLHFEEAAEEALQLYDAVTKADTELNRMKNEVLYTNTMHMLVGAGKFQKALQLAAEFLQFLSTNKNFEKMLHAYAEIANIHICMFPKPSSFQPIFLLKQLDKYQQTVAKSQQPTALAHLLVLRLKLLTTMDMQKEAANTLHQLQQINHGFSDDFLATLSRWVRVLSLAVSPERDDELEQFKANCQKLKLRSTTPSQLLFYRWFEQAIHSGAFHSIKVQ